MDTQSFCNLLDQAIYDMNRAPNPQAIRLQLITSLKLIVIILLGLLRIFLMFIMNKVELIKIIMNYLSVRVVHIFY